MDKSMDFFNKLIHKIGNKEKAQKKKQKKTIKQIFHIVNKKKKTQTG